MLLHLARISVISIAFTLVGVAGYLLSRPQAPNVITVVIPASPAVAPAPTTVVQPVVAHPYYPYCGYGTRVSCYPYYWR